MRTALLGLHACAYMYCGAMRHACMHHSCGVGEHAFHARPVRSGTYWKCMLANSPKSIQIDTHLRAKGTSLVELG